MRYLSCFSGIEAASVAWGPLGWECVGVAEVDPFASAVLAYRFPAVPNFGDVMVDGFLDRVRALSPDVVIAGPPCQDFSVAGPRAGLKGRRGNLTMRWLEIIDAAGDAVSVTENVPGWFSVDGGHAFGAFLAGLVGESAALEPTGGRWTDAGMVDGPRRRAAWRVLDAQYFGLAQRRQRVFVVGCSRAGGIDPAQVLFEPSRLRRNPAPRREAGEDIAPPFGDVSNGDGTNGPGRTVDSADSLIAYGARQSDVIQYGDRAGPLDTDGFSQAMAFTQNSRSEVRLNGGDGQVTGALAADHGVQQQTYVAGSGVRRLTPRECERLQGFPDDWTLIPYRGKLATDGPRYHAIGNSMAVPVIRWIGKRLELGRRSII